MLDSSAKWYINKNVTSIFLNGASVIPYMLSVAESKVVEKNRTGWAFSDLSFDTNQMFQKAIKVFQKFKLGEASKVPSISEPPQAIVQELIKMDKSNQILGALAKIDPMQRHFPKAMISLKVQAKSR